MTNYVLSFVFNPDLTRVLLIKKNRPKALAGKWNGIGGKIELDENYFTAAYRELNEEAGITAELKYLGKIDLNPELIHCFYGKSDDFDNYKTLTDEVIRPAGIKTLAQLPIDPDAAWLIMLSLANLNGSFVRMINVTM